mmetsp:Transcript_32566/g.85810  ORF Transcript_32566/g.85810 Transcript_32566/m.85810 type:complete len:221 (+) Transcript_32566:234-896(+)
MKGCPTIFRLVWRDLESNPATSFIRHPLSYTLADGTNELQAEMDEIETFLREAADINNTHTPYPLARMACERQGGWHVKAQFVVESMYYLKIIELAVALLIILFIPLMVVTMALLYFYKTLWWALVATETIMIADSICRGAPPSLQTIVSVVYFIHDWSFSVRDFVVLSVREIKILGMPPVPPTPPGWLLERLQQGAHAQIAANANANPADFWLTRLRRT